ncbi:myosin-11 isoform X2 [Drosophila erecta]|uniref:myosin-11 isoform X2 n=1 Tax=Drosophila erecta TaxID=7220 RepID=UPI000F04CF80|nr:myosin-11 isoform X2 [Drosophila erecta]
MDMRSWRKVLLQWIGECQFIEPNYISLEQSDIESFFAIFIQKIEEAETETETEKEEGEKALQDQPKEHRLLLQEFLTNNYPEFSAHLDDRGYLLPSDYLYVYTLLLQYSCVKKPSMFFHGLCNKMPELTQTCIASFLGETVDKQLTRQYLRQAIANVAAVYRQEVSASVSPCHPSSIPIPDLGGDDTPCSPSPSSSQPSSSTPQLHNHRERLRLQMSASEMPPPATPKTELLEQRTKELRGIRAQLEMVRYEKTVLEEQQIEKDDLIKVLKKEKMMAKIEMEKLKNTKLAEEQLDDENSVMPHEYEHMKVTLLKEIGQKEDVIAEISDKLDDLRAEKSGLSERLNLTGERLLEYADRIRVLESRVEDLLRILSFRDDRIASLERERQELDQCLQLAREELHGRREVLNASSDLLNCSLSPNTTPENLASSVIDKQLREKEHENAELKEELQNRNHSQLELCRALSNFLQKHKIDHEFPVEWTPLSLLSSISAIESSFVDTVSQNTQMKKECDDRAVYIEKCKFLSESLECQQKQLDEAKFTIAELMESAAESHREYAGILSFCDLKVADIRSKNNKLQLDKERLNKKCAELKLIVAHGDQHMANISLQLAEKEQKMKDLGAEILELRERNSNLEKMISEVADQEINAKNLQHCNEFVRSKYEECRKELIIKNAAQDEFARMLKVRDHALETMHCRIRQLIDLEVEHDKLNLMYAQMVKQFDELSAQHAKLMQTNLELGEKETEIEKQAAQLLQFDEHNKNVDRFLTRIFTLLGGSKCHISSAICSASSMGSVQIEQRFEEIETLIEGALLSSDALRGEMNDLQAKNEELVLKSTHGENKLKSIVASMEENSEKLQEEICSSNQRIAQLENALSEEHSNAEQVAQRLHIAQQDIEQYHVETMRLLNTIGDRLHQDFDGVNTPQQLHNCMSQFLEIYDQLAQNKSQMEQEAAELQKEVARQQATNQQSGPLIKQLNDTIQDLERVKAKLSEDNSVLHTVHSEMSESLLRAHNELESRINRVAELEASEKRSSVVLHDCKRQLEELKKELKSYKMKVAKMKAECDKEAGTKEEQISEVKEMYEKQMAILKAECGTQTEEKEGLQTNLEETKDKLFNLEEMCKKLAMTARDEHEPRCKEHDKRCADLRNLCKELEEQLDNNEREVTLELPHCFTDDLFMLESEEELDKKIKWTENQLDKVSQSYRFSSAEIKSLQTKLHDQELAEHLKISFDMINVKNKFESCLLFSTTLAEKAVKVKEEFLCMQAEAEQKLVETLKVQLDRKGEELDLVKAALEAQKKHSDDLQSQKESAQRDVFTAKERLVKSEREFQVNLATLEDQIETLEERQVMAETERATAYQRINQLETLNQEKDDTISKLQGQISNVEQLRHQLQSEMGGHKSLVEQLNRELAEKASELLDVQKRLRTAIAECNQAKEELDHISDRPEVVELQHRLAEETAERKQAQKKLAEVTDRLDEVVQELDGTRFEHDAQKLKFEEKVREAENNNVELTKSVELYKQRLDSLERELAACNEELAHLNSVQANQTEASRDLGATYSTADRRHTESDQETARSHKLALDCQILQAKYRDAKDENQRCEQKMKDQRLEMEGKLEKMKNKMRSLYTAEVTRMKEKQERDASKSAAELEALTAQNAKYEEHTRKLSNQIVRLNEKILEQQKQHAIISTKLRHLQMQPISETKPSTTPLTVSSSSAGANDDWQPFKRPNVPSSNLAMEDEEGEVFNNTYLTDLKLGRVPAEMTAEELIYRNSLQPPHLKSTYAAQYDLGSQDEDLKDGPHSLDDSMSALLSSSSTGTRKKSMGTHYKRPGPPTPSKNGGRLSFGSSEPPREILREFGDHNNTSKTPARFKFLTQRFSVGSSGLPRDENSPPKRRLSNMFKRK